MRAPVQLNENNSKCIVVDTRHTSKAIRHYASFQDAKKDSKEGHHQ